MSQMLPNAILIGLWAIGTVGLALLVVALIALMRKS